MSVGLTAHHLGAGRQIPGDSINYAVGVQLKSQVGDFVNAGTVVIFFFEQREFRDFNCSSHNVIKTTSIFNTLLCEKRKSVADPGFPRRGALTPEFGAKTYYLA